MSTHVCFAYSPEQLSRDGRLPDRPRLFAKLAARGLSPMVSLGAESAFRGDGVEMRQLGMAERGIGGGARVALQAVGVIVNRVDRSLKPERLPQPKAIPPLINENATRRLVWRKDIAQERVLAPLGLGLPTALIASPRDVADFLDQRPESGVVIKSRNGSLGKGVAKVARDELPRWFSENPDEYAKRIVQPAYDFTQPFPAELGPYDQASREAFEGWNAAGKTKELRMYGFHSPLGTRIFPAARAIEAGDQWFFVDPESVPAELADGTRRAIERTAEQSGALALYGTVDYGYGSAGSEDPAWHAIELNGLAPYMIGYEKHVGVADRLRTFFADQIEAAVRARDAWTRRQPL